MSRLVIRLLGFDIFEVSTEVEEVEAEEEFVQPGAMGGVDGISVEVTPAPLGFGSRHPEPLPTFDPWPDE